MNSETLSSEGINGLCVVLSMPFSKQSIKEGRRVTQHITPITTPFIITIPMFLPSAKVMSMRAANPATVVTELPVTERKVSSIAFAIACSLGYFFLLSM